MRLTDNTGIVQHAKYGIPNLKEGYCLDDNTRALLMTTMAYQQLKSPEALRAVAGIFKFYSLYANRWRAFQKFSSFQQGIS